MSEQYSWQQKVFSLTWLPTLIGMLNDRGTQEELQELFTQRVKEVLVDAGIQKLIGKWELSWGIAVYQYHKYIFNSNGADNTMFMAKYVGNPASKEDLYVISIAGTNPRSLFNWKVIDSVVDTMDLWNQGKPWNKTENVNSEDDRPAIATGMSQGTKVLMADMSANGGRLLLDYLKELTTNATKPMTITVTGHSMAGGLSPCLGLALLDRQSEWDSEKIATVKVFSVGGPAPGNANFATYYNNKFGENAQRVWNQRDLVPLAWEPELLARGASIFEPYIKPNYLLDILIKFMQDKPKGYRYEHVSKLQEERFAIEYYKGAIQYKELMGDIFAYVVARALTYIWLIMLGSISFLVADVVKDDLFELVDELSEDLSQFINKSLKAGKSTLDLATTLEEWFSDALSKMTLGMWDLSKDALSNLPVRQYLSPSNITKVILFMMQEVYQHLLGYVEYFQIDDFHQQSLVICRQSVTKKERVRESVLSKIAIFDYGKVDSDDIKELQKREGKLLKNISGKIGELIVEGTLDEEVQPVIVILQKKKTTALFDCLG